MEDAERYLASKIGIKVEEIGQYIESEIQTKKYKITLVADGEDFITRFFRLVVDESIILGGRRFTPDRLRQIELEYKGSNKQEEDSLEKIKEQMEKIISAMKSAKDIQTKETTNSKRKWALQ